MTLDFDLDLTDFSRAVNYVFEHSHKTIPQVLNRGALTAIIGGKGVQGAMQRTKKALREAILAVPVDQVAKMVMAKHRGEKMSRLRVKQLIRKEYARRIASIGYTALLGWDKAAVAFGGRGIKGAHGHGTFQFGSGKPATDSDLVAEGSNTTPAAALIGEQPMQEALNDVAEDMVEFWGGEIDKVLTRAGAK
jgi:hypothetical protein